MAIGPTVQYYALSADQCFFSIESHQRVRTHHETYTPRPNRSTSSQTPYSSVDDPLTWGVLPLRYHFNPSNHRWSLGSYDIVFKNKSASPRPAKPPETRSNQNQSTEPCPPSSSSAKSSPPTASTKTGRAGPSNPPSAKPSACSLVLPSPL